MSGFTRAGLRRGVKVALPLLIGLLPFALVVGVVSGGKGLTLAETVLMSALVFAGASQLLALELWADPVPLLAVGLAALVVNLRLLPMGAALAPWFRHVRGWRVWLTLATMTDHVFAFSVPEERAGRLDVGFLLGVGLVSWAGWVVISAGGHLLGSAVRLGAGNPLFFAAVSAFVALLVPMWRDRRRDLLPWALAAVVAIGANAAGWPPPVPLLLGALSGAALGAWRAR
ncbi:AzlC family ABC transporter permease [Roseomonas sp. BN140053]|uniref:AzlC family ABC transporter permease n=1 Tax=Roseomonas sp. BN140053 TaxID=3391898 RepID=UPI0039ED9A85